MSINTPSSSTRSLTGSRGPLAKRAMRAAWLRIPRSQLSYNMGKVLIRALLPPSGRQELVLAHFDGRIPMQLDVGDHVGNDLFCLDTHYESTTLQLWRRLSSQASTILDIGSHIGTYSLVSAEANPHARILAIEADVDNFGLLQLHCRNYPNVKTINAAVSQRPGTMWFCHNLSNSGGGSLKDAPMDGQRCHLIQTHSLESVCSEYSVEKIDLMKIDVEGYEHALLTEDAEFWDRYKPTHVIAEVYQERGRAKDKALFDAMRKRGYVPNRVQGLMLNTIRQTSDLANWHFWRR